MREAQFEYSCRRCGELFHNPCCSRTLARSILQQIATHGYGGDFHKGGRVHAICTHGCEDGGEGLADMMGYRMQEVG